MTWLHGRRLFLLALLLGAVGLVGHLVLDAVAGPDSTVALTAGRAGTSGQFDSCGLHSGWAVANLSVSGSPPALVTTVGQINPAHVAVRVPPPILPPRNPQA